MNKALCAMLFVCMAAVIPTSTHAQAWPGGRGSLAAKQRNDYLAFVREGVDEMVRKFENAASERDAAKLAELYVDAATLVTARGTVLGREPVRDRFARALPRMRAIKLRIETFSASGELAFVAGRLSYEVVHANGAHAYDLPVSMVLEQHRQNAWRIQAQVGGELPVFVAALSDSPNEAAPGSSTTIGVVVTDAAGIPIPDVLVAFELDAGHAKLVPTVVSTNAKGIASTQLELGDSSDNVRVRATASALAGEPVIFSISPTQLAGKPGAKSVGAPAPIGEQ